MSKSETRSAIFLLKTEGLVLLFGALVAFWQFDVSWWWMLAILVPDISMMGYLQDTKTGALTYNIGHSAILPGLLAIVGFVNNWPTVFAVSLVWLAHIGIDRALGYGLKYSDGFKHTHLGSIGK